MIVYEYLQEAIWDTSQVLLSIQEDAQGRATSVTVSGTIPLSGTINPNSPTPYTPTGMSYVTLSGGTYAVPPPLTTYGTHDQWYVVWHMLTGMIRVCSKGEISSFSDGFWATLVIGFHANGDPRAADVVHITRHGHWKSFGENHPPHYGFFPDGHVEAVHFNNRRIREIVHPPLV